MASFYRIVRTNPPDETDFVSDKARGLPPRNDEPLTLHVWDGISVYRTLAQAERKARDYPFLGTFIAELNIDIDVPRIRIEKTFGRGHHTLWGPTAILLRSVVAVTAVRAGA
jgi:hypothetical protein